MHKNFSLIKTVTASIVISTFSFSANAQSGCVKVDQIAKWEVLDSTKTIIYDSQENSVAFIIFGQTPYLKKSGETFRFFSPTICRFDRVQISGGMTTIVSIEPIRK
jgi:hypothetical protein